jgi:hypothetical protein
LSTAVAEEAVIDVIADFLHWLRAHGCDGDEVLDRAQTHFEAELSGSVLWTASVASLKNLSEPSRALERVYGQK